MDKFYRVALLVFIATLIAACSAAPASPTPTPGPTATPTPLPTLLEKDLFYLRGLNPEVDDQKVDIYHPAEPGAWPVVVYAHGSTESKEHEVSRKLGSTLAGKGAVVYVLDWDPILYEVAMMNQGRGLRELAEAASCAARFARATAADYGGDPGKLTWLGFSAGADFGGMAAFHTPDDALMWDAFSAQHGGPEQQAECQAEGGSDRVDALVVSSGYFFPPEGDGLAESDPVSLLSRIYSFANNPELRVHVINGTNDSLVPPEIVEQFIAALEEAGLVVQRTVLPGGHGLYLDQAVEAVMQLSRGE